MTCLVATTMHWHHLESKHPVLLGEAAVNLVKTPKLKNHQVASMDKKKKKDKRILYRNKLMKEARYFQKLSTIDNADPYDLDGNECSLDVSLLPPTTTLDIKNYLVFGISS